MSSQLSQQIFNPALKSQDNTLQFHLFHRLPPEIRSKIWRHALERRRRIKVQLVPTQFFVNHPQLNAYSSLEDVSEANLSQRFCAYAFGYQTMSRLLRVNQEARQEVLRFYRVHIPCRLTPTTEDIFTYMSRDEIPKYGVLYFNPEFDLLHISLRGQPEDCLVDFLYHLRTKYDPHHVGVRNLILSPNSLSMFPVSNLESPGKQAFLDTFKQLSEVYFLIKNQPGRTHCGMMITGTTENFFNRSYPIMAMSPNFEVLARDPRPISQDLRRVFIAQSHPLQMYASWKKLLADWGVLSTDIQYKCLVASTTIGGSYVHGRKDAVTTLQKEDIRWKDMQKTYKFDYKEDIEDPVKPAFGFWLFPLEAFGLLRRKGNSSDEKVHNTVNRMWDLSEYSPELILCNLL
jgi:2EXR family protein